MRRERRQPRTHQAGLTLIELMVAVVILSFAIAAALSLAYTLLGGFTDSERVIKAQRAARSSLELIGDAIRASSPGVTTGQIYDLANCPTAMADFETQPIVVDNSSTDTDILTVIHAAGGVIGFLADPLQDDDDEITVTAENGEFFDRLYFEQGDLLLIANGTNGHVVRVSNVTGFPTAEDISDTTNSPTEPWVLEIGNSGQEKLDEMCNGSNNVANTEPFQTGGEYPAGSLVIRVRQSRFKVCTIGSTPYLVVGDNIDDDCNPDPNDDDSTTPADESMEPLAEGIEDLQVEVLLDSGQGSGPAPEGGAADDGRIYEKGDAANDDEVYYNDAGDLAPTLLSNPTRRWTALRVTVTARTMDESSKSNASARPAAGDRAAGTADVYRRRTLSTVLELRNIQGQ
jgi:prepilin-type N-terminal cleavage/methylation domain-containing protein